MPNNTTLDPGAGGDTIATDDVAGVKYQRVKLVDGTEDSTAAIPGDATNGLDVDVTRVQGNVAVTGTFWQATQPVSGSVSVSNFPATQPVSGTVTADTELPAAAALADTTANPTVPAVGGFSMLWNGTTWDRVPGTAANGLKVTGPLTDTQLRATPVPVSGTVTANAGTGPFPVSDNAGSLTVDAPVGTPAFVRLSDGAAAITALPVTDNSSSLTVDAPVGTPVFARLSDGAATLIGQKAMASSLPVVIASDQSAVAVSGTVTASGPLTDTQLRASRVPIGISDGTDEATVLPVRTQPATTEKALNVQVLPTRLPSYSAVTAEVAPAITIGVKELFCIWKASTVTQDIYIVEITVSVLITTASTTGGRTNVEVLKVTSAPTGGTAVTPADIGGAGASNITNAMQVKTGGGALGTAIIRQGIEHATEPLGYKRVPIFQSSALEEAILLRGGANDGINIQVNRVVAHTALVDQWTAQVRWIEL